MPFFWGMSVFQRVPFFRDQYFLEVLFFRNRCFQRSVFLGRWIVFRNVSFSRKSRALFQAQEGGVGGDSGRFEAGVFFGLLSLFRLSGAVQFGVAVLEMRQTRGGCADKSEGFGRCAE